MREEKLVMRSDQTLFLYDVLFVSDIHQNLMSMLVLIKLDFELCFHGQGLELCLSKNKPTTILSIYLLICALMLGDQMTSSQGPYEI